MINFLIILLALFLITSIFILVHIHAKKNSLDDLNNIESENLDRNISCAEYLTENDEDYFVADDNMFNVDIVDDLISNKIDIKTDKPKKIKSKSTSNSTKKSKVKKPVKKTSKTTVKKPVTKKKIIKKKGK